MTRQKRPLTAIKYLVVHHTASADAYSTHETLDAHQRATGLGYHATIDDDAALKAKAAGADGKFTFKQHAPLDEVVWGAAGCNYNGAHVAIDGNGLIAPPTNDEVYALVQVLATWAKQLGWKKSDVGRIVGHDYIGKHVSATRYITECPGKPIIALLPAIRARVAAYLPA
jgi:hypothetical protein